jgi:ankyrin repeat protein
MAAANSCRSQRGRDIYMRTPLHNAVLERDTEYIRALLNSGAERCDTKAADNATCLHLACKGRNGGDHEATEVAQMILDHSTGRATIDWQCLPKHKKSGKKYTPAVCGYTPLLYAIKAENPALVQLLLSYGASLELPGWVPPSQPKILTQNNDGTTTTAADGDDDDDDADCDDDSDDVMQKVCPPLLAAKQRRDVIGSPSTIAVYELLCKAQSSRSAAASASTTTAVDTSSGTEQDGNSKRQKVVVTAASSRVDSSSGDPWDSNGHSRGESEYMQMMSHIMDEDAGVGGGASVMVFAGAGASK